MITEYSDKVFLGDCLEIMPQLPDGIFDMILCDLPYGTTACKWDDIIPFEKLWEQYSRLIKPNGAVVLTASMPFTAALVMSNVEMFRYRWIWDKKIGANFQLAKLQPMNTVEDICVFSKAKTANGAKLNMAYYPIKTKRDKPITYGGRPSTETLNKHNMGVLFNEDGTKKTYTDKYPTSILPFDKEKGFHPTQKPVPLFEYLIKTYTNEGELVLDNCAGSGTTGVACKNTNRHYTLIEKDEKYYDGILKRLKQIQLPTFRLI